MRTISLAYIILLLVSAGAHASDPATQPTTAPAADDAFPNTWIGTYRGPCVYTALGGETRRFEMELQIVRTDDPNRYKYQITYIENGERQVRPYQLKVIDATAGKFVIDEKNSINIDAYFIDGALYSEFTVGRVRIMASYRMQDHKILMELVTIDPNRPTTTGGGDGVPDVRTYPIRGIQRAVLERSK